MRGGDVSSAARVAATAVALVISGEVGGWNTALGVSTWSGLLAAAFLIALLYFALLRGVAALTWSADEAAGLGDLVASVLGRPAGQLVALGTAAATLIASAAGLIFFSGYSAALLSLPDGVILPAAVGFLALMIATSEDSRDRATMLLAAIGVIGVLLFIALALGHLGTVGPRALPAAPDASEVWRAMPAAVWLFFAIEFTPLAVGRRPAPRPLTLGLSAGFACLAVLAFSVISLAPAVAAPDRLALSSAPLVTAGEAITDRALFIKALAAFCAISLAASLWGAMNAAVTQLTQLLPVWARGSRRDYVNLAGAHIIVLGLAWSGTAADLIATVVLIMTAIYLAIAVAVLRARVGSRGWALIAAGLAAALAAASIAQLRVG